MRGIKSLNTEAQGRQSPRASSSVPPCFKNPSIEVLNSQAGELEERIANNVANLLEASS